ncbi:PLD nuclease N-terminal domain-containing protein [Paracoccus sp. PAR01]
MGSFMKFIIGLIIFALDVWAIAMIINSNAETSTKILWIALVAFLPVLGLIIWWFAGPKPNYSA